MRAVVPGAPRVSVVIPAYNRAGSIADAIRSVLNQSFEDFELIVVDDGSSDDTVERARAIRDARVRVVVHARNLGANAARNTGVAMARGFYTAFNDSDDEWLPRKLELQLKALAARAGDGAGACYCGMITYGMTEGLKFAGRAARYWPERHLKVVDGDIYRALLRTSLVSTQTLIAKTELLRRIGGFNVTLKSSQDWELVLRLAKVTRFAFVERPLVLASLSTDSISKDRWNHARTREFVLRTHYDAIAGDRALLAFYLRRAADHFQHVGERDKELRHLLRAVQARPEDPRNWGRLAAAALRPRTRAPAARSQEAC
jgi:glycosyltransferase involved in cell wall biosynthesis